MHDQSAVRRVLIVLAAAASVGGMTAAPALARPAPVGPGARPAQLSPARVQAIRDRQQRMTQALRTTPRFSRLTAATTFTVNTTDDSDLADPAGTTCQDAADGSCSLRAAIHAANKLKQPVRVVLDSATYTLSSHTALFVSDPAGISVVGTGASTTVIDGDNATGVFDVDAASSTDPGALLFLTGVTVTGGAASAGGGIYLGGGEVGSTAVLNDDVITHNTATNTGGGIHADNADTLYMTNTEITYNSAPDGAGMYLFWASSRLVNCTIAHNTSPPAHNGYGGGFDNEYGVLVMSGGSVSHNTAGDDSDTGFGGGIYDYSGDVTLSGVSVNYNRAKANGNGGGIYAYSDQVDITRGSISHDSTVEEVGTDNGSEGGGLSLAGSQVGLHAVTMAADTADGIDNVGTGGGAVFVNADPYGSRLVIDSGSKITAATGSAVYAYADNAAADVDISNSTLSGNQDSAANGMNGWGCGGAVCAYETSGSLHLEMTGDTISGNTSAGNNSGGAVSVFGDVTDGGTVQLSHCEFTSNHTDASGAGGAVLVSATANTQFSVRSSANTFHGNSAGTPASPGYGGALAIYGAAALTDSGSKFTANKAVGAGASGGAVHDVSPKGARYTGTVFTGNASSGYGGALYTSDVAGDVFDQVSIAGNKAVRAGGGVYGDSTAYQLEFERSTISGNTAGTSTRAGAGGGLYAGDAVLVLENSTVAGNQALSSTTAHGQGGGIWLAGGTLGLRYSTVSGNNATQGGGIYADGAGGTLLASIVSANHDAPGGAEQDCTTASATATLASAGENILGRGSCVAGIQPSDAMTTHPGLKPLANNGGPTRTMALKATSPAIDRAGSFYPSTDQRGEPRQAKHGDAGAYERAAASVTSVQPGRGHAGARVTIYGSGFSFARRVHFGATAARFQILSDHRILVAHAPKRRSGKVAVTVTTPDGTAKHGWFTYIR